MKTKTMLTAAALMVLIGCETDTGQDWSVSRHALSTGDEVGLLDFLNDPWTTFERLDVACEIRSDSARQIIKHRNGRDKEYGTHDDDPFDSVAEVDDVAMVGAWTLERLEACAVTFGFIVPDPDTCEPLPYDGDSYEEIYDYSYLRHGDLDPALAAIVDELEEDAQAYRETSVWFPMEFSHVEVYSSDGIPLVYEVAIRQWLDTECGVLLWVVYTLDSCHNIVATHIYV